MEDQGTEIQALRDEIAEEKQKRRRAVAWLYDEFVAARSSANHVYHGRILATAESYERPVTFAMLKRFADVVDTEFERLEQQIENVRLTAAVARAVLIAESAVTDLSGKRGIESAMQYLRKECGYTAEATTFADPQHVGEDTAQAARGLGDDSEREA